MNSYRNILEQKKKMYDDILNLDKIEADDVIIVFPNVEWGWFDASIIVNNVEEYLFSFSDYNEDLYKFVDWLKESVSLDNTQSSVYLDCERQHIVFTLEKLAIEAKCATYSPVGLLWWYDEVDDIPEIKYCIVDIDSFVAKTYLALLHTSISKRFNILACWCDEFMRESDEMDKSKYYGYEFIKLKNSPELVQKRLQLLFYNKVRDENLDRLYFKTPILFSLIPKQEIVDVIFLCKEGDHYILRDLNGNPYTEIPVPEITDNMFYDAIQIRKQLPQNVSLFCRDFKIEVVRRAPDVIDQNLYSQHIPILIPLE